MKQKPPNKSRALRGPFLLRAINKQKNNTTCAWDYRLTFNINELTSAISSAQGLLYASHFYVQITPPKCLGGSDATTKLIPLFCDATSMPGLQYQPFDIRPSGFGLFESRPIQANFPNQSFSFYCDAQGNLQKMFQKWMQNIQNFNVNQSSSSTVNGAGLGIFQYPEWYECRIDIFQFDPTGKKVQNKWTLENAYPMTMNPVPISWDQPDQLLKLSVDFWFKAWGTEATTSGSSGGSESNNYNLTRIDPNVSAALTDPSARNSAINGNFSLTSYGPIASDSSTSAPNVSGASQYQVMTNQSQTPSFAQGNLNNNTGFGSTFVTFNGT